MKNSIYFFIIFLILNSCSKEVLEPKVTISKNKFKINISASTGGKVDNSGGEFDEGISFKVTATPNEDYVFKDWSGDLSTNYNPLSFVINKNYSLQANFSLKCNEEKFNQIDLKLPSYFQDLVFHFNKFNGAPYNYGAEKIAIDYNLDGYKDLIYCFNDYDVENNRQLVKFYKNDCNGNLIEDEVNSNKFLGLVHSRKILSGDLNNDNYPDIIFIGHGWDKPPFPGEYPLILLSNGDSNYIEKRLENYVGFFHGGATGDIDSDGDLDLILVNNANKIKYLTNDGFGNFEENEILFKFDLASVISNIEIIDINEDNYLDLIYMGFEGEGYNENPPEIFFGPDFATKKEIPRSNNKYRQTMDLLFYDLNNDGKLDIIQNKTNYNDWGISIFINENDEFIDKTNELIEENIIKNNWTQWIYLSDFDKDGILELYNERNPFFNESYNEWEFINGKFSRVK